MAQTEDLSGKRFGRWTVLERVPGNGAAKWRCRCQCGTERIVLARSLKAGVSQSCGCLNKERVKGAHRLDLAEMRFGKLTAQEKGCGYDRQRMEVPVRLWEGMRCHDKVSSQWQADKLRL